ncbi:MAG: AAA family ATPase [archaeon]
MIGQDKVLNKTSKSKGPFLIIGPSGSGKTTLGKEIIKREISKYDKSKVPIFEHNNYPDYQYIKDIKVKDLRSIIQKLSVKPYYNKNYVLIDDIDKLNGACQDALLKTIEENSNSLIIITGTFDRRILKTIKSRCIKLTPQFVDNNIIKDIVKKKIDDDKYIENIVFYSEGRIGYANKMLEEEEFYKSMINDLKDVKSKGPYVLSQKYGKEFKSNFCEIVSFIELFVSKNYKEKDIMPILDEIYKIKQQQLNNINLSMAYLNLFIELEKV